MQAESQPRRSRLRTASIAVATLALTSGLAACGGAAEETGADGETTLTFLFPNQRSVQYYAHYVALENGYFEDEGLEVEFEVVDGSSSVVQQVAAGNADIGMAAGSAALQGAARGLSMKFVYTWWYLNTFALAAPTESGITSMEDLGDGSVIGVSSMSGGEVPEVRGIMSGDLGFTEGEDYSIQAVGDGGALTFDALESGQVDAYSSSVFDVATVEMAGLPLTQLFEGDYLYLPSLGHVVGTETLEEKEEALAKFHRAIVKGYRFTEQNEEAAKEIARKHGPELFEDEAVGDAFWDVSVEATAPPESMTDELLGLPYMPGWETYMRLISEGTSDEGAIAEGEVDLDTMMDNRLMETANDFDPAELDAEGSS